MIRLFTGTPGSGKSLHAARCISDYLLTRKNVIANFEVNLSVFKKRRLGNFLQVDNIDITPQMFYAYSLANHACKPNGNMIENQTLIIIDECQILFNSRDWNVKNRMDWCTFFMQHRKYGYNIILVSQADRLIDRQIRCLVEYEVKHRKVSNFGIIGALLGAVFMGRLFIAVTLWYGIREKTDSEFFVFHKKYAEMYNSYKIFNPTEHGGRGDPRDGALKKDS